MNDVEPSWEDFSWASLQTDGSVLVECPYVPELVALCKDHRGKWEKENRLWIIPKCQQAKMLARASDVSDLVEAKIAEIASRSVIRKRSSDAIHEKRRLFCIASEAPDVGEIIEIDGRRRRIVHVGIAHRSAKKCKTRGWPEAEWVCYVYYDETQEKDGMKCIGDLLSDL